MKIKWKLIKLLPFCFTLCFSVYFGDLSLAKALLLKQSTLSSELWPAKASFYFNCCFTLTFRFGSHQVISFRVGNSWQGRSRLPHASPGRNAPGSLSDHERLLEYCSRRKTTIFWNSEATETNPGSYIILYTCCKSSVVQEMVIRHLAADDVPI